MSAVEIVSFGYLHGAPPSAHLTVDLREHFRDPHVSPELRHMTALDDVVQNAVMGTPGIASLAFRLSQAVRSFGQGPSGDKPIRVAVGCAGGRHRAPTVAMQVAEWLDDHPQYDVAVTHRDLHRPVVER